MDAQLTTAPALGASTVISGPTSLNSLPDRETVRMWFVRLLTVALILAGLVMTFHIFATLGFAVYGLPRSSFRRAAEPSAA
jgi:hypothetical protein